jgi:hypothetical protein
MNNIKPIMVTPHKKPNIICKFTNGEMSQKIEKNSEPIKGQTKKCKLLHVINTIPM